MVQKLLAVAVIFVVMTKLYLLLHYYTTLGFCLTELLLWIYSMLGLILKREYLGVAAVFSARQHNML